MHGVLTMRASTTLFAATLTAGVIATAIAAPLYVTSTSGPAADGTTSLIVRPTATVATLPTCNAAARGTMFVVTDALTPVSLATATGGGAVVMGVLCSGTTWIIQ